MAEAEVRPPTPSLASSTTAIPANDLPLAALQKEIDAILATEKDSYDDDEVRSGIGRSAF